MKILILTGHDAILTNFPGLLISTLVKKGHVRCP